MTDGVGEAFEFVVFRFEFGGAVAHALLQLGIEPLAFCVLNFEFGDEFFPLLFNPFAMLDFLIELLVATPQAPRPEVIPPPIKPATIKP